MCETPRGYHFYYRCSEIEGNQKLAMGADNKTLIETRGQGGYVVAPGSPPECHPSGKQYEHRCGAPLAAVPTITPDERKTLLRVARSLSELEDEQKGAHLPTADIDAPGSEFNRVAEWANILTPHGWVLDHERNGTSYWRRPGKDVGWSATAGCRSSSGNELLCCFSTNASPFKGARAGGACTTYTKLGVFTLLEHDGDFSAAARELGGMAPKKKQLDSKCNVVIPYREFPLDALPEAMGDFARETSEGLCCDSALVALPLLCGLAGAVGATCRIELKRGWYEPCILWGAVVSPSGSQKSEAQKKSVQPLEDAQAFHLSQEAEALEDYELNMRLYNEELRDWTKKKNKNKKFSEPPPEQPKEPPATRYTVDNLTIESLRVILSRNPRELLVAADELGSWLGSMGRYARGAASGEKAQWLSMYRGERLLVDRIAADQRTVHIRNAAISIVRGIPPIALRKAISREDMANGLAARLLIAYPPRRPKRWTSGAVSLEIECRIERIYARLLALAFADTESKAPLDIPISPDAIGVVERFVNRHGEEQDGLGEHLAAVWSKLEAVTFRLSLLFSLTRWAEGGDAADAQQPVQAEDIESAIRVVEWFGNEWRRFHQTIGSGEDIEELRRLAEWIAGKGGAVSIRDVQRGNQRRFPSAEDAETVLRQLEKAGFGKLETGASGLRGRPSQRFALNGHSEG